MDRGGFQRLINTTLKRKGGEGRGGEGGWEGRRDVLWKALLIPSCTYSHIHNFIVV